MTFIATDNGATLTSVVTPKSDGSFTITNVYRPPAPVITPPVITPPTSGAVIGGWEMEWSESGSPLVSSLSTHLDRLYLAFLQGAGQPVGWGAQSQASLTADLAAMRARGVKVLAGIGGSGGAVNLSNAAAFGNAVIAYGASLGNNLDGICWDIEGVSLDVQQAFNISYALCVASPGFQIDLAPNGSNVGQYLTLAKMLQQENILGYYGQQFYEAPVNLAAVEGRLAESQNNGIPIEKTLIGMMIGNDANHWTLQQCIDIMTAVKKNHPTIGGTYAWEEGRPFTRVEWPAAMAKVLGS